MTPCHWDKGEPCKDCKPPEWVIAWMCERCGNENVFEICSEHYETYFTNAQSTAFACGGCHGNVSYMAQAIHSEDTSEMIIHEL